MKTVSFMAGMAAGMVMAGAALSAAYPDVPKRMGRDAKKMVRCGRRDEQRAQIRPQTGEKMTCL